MPASAVRPGCCSPCSPWAGRWLPMSSISSPTTRSATWSRRRHPVRDISKRFLKDPWRWASVWTINEQIKNPHLIYPGDVIVLTYVDGKPQLSVQREEKLAPALRPPRAAPAEVVEEPAGETPGGMKVARLQARVYSEPIKEAIPTISPDQIVPFLTEPLVVDPGSARSAPAVRDHRPR
ncbi:MAG: hypothetical protein MZV65_17510 [Chromatiales bacterium]|nr:hypothetical protein [Chromatiales bacterium]